ncbi:deoxyribodipyrimidine photo-lyase [mine drainage metagenome]|uniref:Deoxyribodipyrimidine photo-lyase n=1 Tax=mine drainage metagenome TaxID=410659 RepID=A0A1J5QX42_9ZZZZ
MTSVLWLRRDLRLRDHPALVSAHESAGVGGVLPVFVADPRLLGPSGRTGALVEALVSVGEAYDGALVVRYGRPAEVLPALVREVGATSVHVSAETTPYGRRRDDQVRAALPVGVPLVATGSPYAVTPGRVLKANGSPYRVFTPFARAWRRHGWRRPADVPTGLRWHRGPESDRVPALDPGRGPAAVGSVGEHLAHARWREFLDSGVAGYRESRDRPDVEGTSGLSAQLRFGAIHPRTMLADLAAARPLDAGVASFVDELCWREFYADVLWHEPASAWADLRTDLTDMLYDPPDGPAVMAWMEGRTGYPFVDAGMRQLAREGWMHNRVRMVAASFLVKDLHVWWPHGARYFLSHLRDGDIASNSHGWQWVAGTGTDAAPYVRVFNPVLQGERFDPRGDYVRRYVPELAHIDGPAVHRPWDAPDGRMHGYPSRVVDHAAERVEALYRYDVARRAAERPARQD